MGYYKQQQFEKRAKRGTKGTTRGGASGTAPVEYRGYVSYPRTDALKRQYDAWALESDDFWESLATAVSMGFKLTVAHNRDDGSYKASYYSTEPDRSDAGLGISAYAAEPHEAILRATFFLAVCGSYRLDAEFFTLPDAPKRDFWD